MIRRIPGGVMGDTIVGSSGASAAVTGGIVGQVTHTSTLPDRPIRQSNAEELHPSVRASPGVVAVVAAMRAPSRHDPPAAGENPQTRKTGSDQITGQEDPTLYCDPTTHRFQLLFSVLFSHDPKQTAKGVWASGRAVFGLKCLCAINEASLYGYLL